MPVVSKTEADAYDKILDAAAELAELIASSRLEIPEEVIEELTIFLAQHGPAVRQMLKDVKRTWP